MSSTVMSLHMQTEPRTRNWARFALVGARTVAAAVAANTLAYYLGSAVVAYDPQFLPLANVSGEIVMTVFPAIIAVLLYAALRRFTRRPAPIFMVVSAVTFVVTLVPVFTYIPTVPGWTSAQSAILVMMHVVAATVIVGMLTTADRSSAR